jgi:hypothetical protein
MAMTPLSTGLDAALAQHCLEQLEAAGIEAELHDNPAGGVDVRVDDARYSDAKALFASPFDEDGESGLETPELRPVRTLAEGERTEVLARTHDVFAAHRLAGMLGDAGLYAAVDTSTGSGTFGLEGPPSVVVVIAEKERERAFRVLEALAREHTDVFGGAANIDPAEVVEALLLAPLGVLRVRSGRSDD